MTTTLGQQAERFYQAFSELVRGYQFRDREGITCYGLSVSQCYTLETLVIQGPATMSQLAERMYLEVSSMTRVVDRLVAEELATRYMDPNDRRVCLVRITRLGRNRVAKIRTELIKEHESILQEIPVGGREAVINAMHHLLSAFQQRQEQRDSGTTARACAVARKQGD